MKWGILATGTIAKKFASTVEQMGAEGEQLVAVGSRHMESAQEMCIRDRPCGMEQIKSYKPSTNSISEGQVLTCPYPNDKAKLIVREMAEILMFRRCV